MHGQRRDTPAMIIRNRDAAQSSEKVVARQHDRQDGDRRGQPEILRRPPEDQREGGVGTKQALGVEPEGEVEQFGRKEDDRAGDSGQNRRSTTPPARR